MLFLSPDQQCQGTDPVRDFFSQSSVTLTHLLLANGVSMHYEGEKDLSRDAPPWVERVWSTLKCADPPVRLTCQIWSLWVKRYQQTQRVPKHFATGARCEGREHVKPENSFTSSRLGTM